MRKLLLFFSAAALTCALGGCTSSSIAKFGSNLNILGSDLGIVAANLPTACGNLTAALTFAAQLQGLSAAEQTAITKAVAGLNKYCGPAAATVTNTQAVIATIQALIVGLPQ